MIERVLQSVLTLGIAKLMRDPGPFERHLAWSNVPAAAIVEWRKQFLSEGVRVIDQFPTLSHAFPIIALRLERQEDDPREFLGRHVSEADEAWGLKPSDAAYGQVVIGGIQSATVTLTIWAQHNSDVCRWTYLLARWLIRKDEDKAIMAMGPLKLTGAELVLDQEKFGDNLFCRQLTASCQYLETQVDEGRSTKPITVEAFLQADGGPEHVDGVATKVVPYVPE